MNLDPTTNITVPQKPDTLVSSSSISGYSYDSKQYILDVWFKSSKGKETIYRYFLIYPTMFAQIFNSGAGIGKKAQKTLKGLRYMKLR